MQKEKDEIHMLVYWVPVSKQTTISVCVSVLCTSPTALTLAPNTFILNMCLHVNIYIQINTLHVMEAEGE